MSTKFINDQLNNCNIDWFLDFPMVFIGSQCKCFKLICGKLLPQTMPWSLQNKPFFEYIGRCVKRQHQLFTTTSWIMFHNPTQNKTKNTSTYVEYLNY